ncbi:hypothetical protein TNCV_4198681 [Trichonephila clavipes]|nr:hypothetical protein TNCV_4198681 [Trichonephila clavipes]
MKYHGMGGHHNQLQYAPACARNWDYDQRYINEALLPYVCTVHKGVGDQFKMKGRVKNSRHEIHSCP